MKRSSLSSRVRRRSMGNDLLLRQHLRNLLRSSDAHLDFDAILADWPRKLRGIYHPGAPHTAWQLLEHMRIAQWDIVEFSCHPDHISPEFPAGYWPKTPAPPRQRAWEDSVNAFRKDLRRMMRLVGTPSRDLLTPIPHGQGQTILREVLVLADHNAYHLGQLMLLRRLLGGWPSH